METEVIINENGLTVKNGKLKIVESENLMNIEDFEIQDGTSTTVAEGKIQLQKLLDSKEFSQEDYDRQMEELNMFDDNLMCAWASRIDWNGGFLDNAGMLYYEAINGKVVDFIGYC